MNRPRPSILLSFDPLRTPNVQQLREMKGSADNDPDKENHGPDQLSETVFFRRSYSSRADTPPSCSSTQITSGTLISFANEDLPGMLDRLCLVKEDHSYTPPRLSLAVQESRSSSTSSCADEAASEPTAPGHRLTTSRETLMFSQLSKDFSSSRQGQRGPAESTSLLHEGQIPVLISKSLDDVDVDDVEETSVSGKQTPSKSRRLSVSSDASSSTAENRHADFSFDLINDQISFLSPGNERVDLDHSRSEFDRLDLTAIPIRKLNGTKPSPNSKSVAYMMSSSDTKCPENCDLQTSTTSLHSAASLDRQNSPSQYSGNKTIVNSSSRSTSSKLNELALKPDASRKASTGKPALSQGRKISSTSEATQPQKPSSVQRPPPGWKPSNNARVPTMDERGPSVKGPQRPERQVLRPPRANNTALSASTMTRSNLGGRKDITQGVTAKPITSNLRQPTVLTKSSHIPTSRLQQPRKYGGLS